MKKLICLQAVLVLLALKVCAAGHDEFSLKPVDTIKNYTVFNQISVIDMRVNKDDVGYLRNGPFNKKNIQVTPDGFDHMLEQFAQVTAGQAVTKGDQTLLIVVRDFSMADRPIQGEMGTFYGRMDFYLGKNDQYQLAAHVDSFFETSNAWDVTNSVKRLAARKMTDWLSLLSGYKIPEGTAVITLSDIEAGIAAEKKPYPIYNSEPKTGVYYTLEQFLNNAPGATEFVEKKYSMGDYNTSYFYEKGEGKKKGASLEKSGCYALYNGKKWYKSTSEGLTPMKHESGEFFFAEVGHGIRKSDNAAIMFGLIGALAEAAASDRKGNALYRMRLDPATGKGYCIERLQ
ncbi:hypothetical protein [Taibaiella koreensis]|uniref:hypothetical protein n=1 Tax=Taibaiella koreensis TaxID=1268548 RepID=UPI000E59ED22|nr:hypothetical protein [Taibaiella koreensis]